MRGGHNILNITAMYAGPADCRTCVIYGAADVITINRGGCTRLDILFVVPYPELEPVVQEVYRDYPEKDRVTVEFKVMTVDMVRPNYRLRYSSGSLRGQEYVSLQEGGNCREVFSYVSI